MTSHTLGIVVVNYASHSLIEANLGGLVDGRPDLRMIIVDNFRDGVASAAIEKLCRARGWELVQNSENLGFGAGVNAGAQRARLIGCDAIVMVNPDLAITQPVADALAQAVRADPTLAVSPRVLRPDGSPWFGGAEVLVAEGRTTTRAGSRSDREGGWLTGACIALSMDLWNRSGGFDDDYFLYWEDVDFSWRIVAAGGHLDVRADLSVVHDVGGTQTSEGKSPTYVYYNTRNRLLFAARQLGTADQAVWRRTSASYARAVALRGSRREFLRNPFRLTWAAFRGTRAGLRYL